MKNVYETKNLGEKIVQNFKNCSELSTVHGYPNVFRSQRVSIKIMWIGCLIVATALCSLLIVQSMLSYFTYEASSKIRVVQQMSTYFPVVAVCNTNSFVTKKGREYALSYFNLKYRTRHGSNNFSDFYDLLAHFNYSMLGMDFEFDMLRHSVIQPGFSEKTRAEFSFAFNETFISCQFDGANCRNESEFIPAFHPEYGLCYVFNAGQDVDGAGLSIKEIERSGEHSGLVTENNYKTWFGSEKTQGLRIFIHNQTQSPLLDEGLNVSPGMCTSIVLEKTFSQTLPEPYSDCQDMASVNSPLVNEMRQSGVSYRHVKCLELCTQLSIIQTCNCYSVALHKVSSFNSSSALPCNTRAQFSCLRRVVRSRNQSESHNKCCVELCPIECETISYSFTVSYTDDYPSWISSELMKHSASMQQRFEAEQAEITHENLQASVACLSIYYNNLKYTSITETPSVTLADLFAKIGGFFGLSLGMSMLSFIEALEFLIESAYAVYESLRANNASTSF